MENYFLYLIPDDIFNNFDQGILFFVLKWYLLKYKCNVWLNEFSLEYIIHLNFGKCHSEHS